MTLQHRAAVRHKVAEILAEAVPQVDGRVFRARTWTMAEAELPALLVYGWQEEKKRSGGRAHRSFYDVTFTLAVEIRVADRSRDGEEMEQELEAIAGAVEDAVLTAAELLLPPRMIEAVSEVKTTFGIDTKTSEVAVGAALVAFSLTWTETSDVPSPAVECQAGDTSLRLKPVPPP
jgi:hypothetical protein